MASLKQQPPAEPQAPSKEKAVLVEDIPTTDHTLAIGDETQEEWYKLKGGVETDVSEWR